jgi:hypothetical protein
MSIKFLCISNDEIKKMHEWRKSIDRLLLHWILYKRHQYTSFSGIAKNLFQYPWSYFYNFSLVKWIGALWTSEICVYIDKDFMSNMSRWIFYNKHVLSKTTWNVQLLKCYIQLRSKINLWRYFCCWSRYSDWLRGGRPRGWSSSPSRVKNFLLPMSSRPAVGSTQPPVEWVPGTLSSGVKQSGREADYSSQASAKVKNM